MTLSASLNGCGNAARSVSNAEIIVSDVVCAAFLPVAVTLLFVVTRASCVHIAFRTPFIIQGIAMLVYCAQLVGKNVAYHVAAYHPALQDVLDGYDCRLLRAPAHVASLAAFCTLPMLAVERTFATQCYRVYERSRRRKACVILLVIVLTTLIAGSTFIGDSQSWHTPQPCQPGRAYTYTRNISVVLVVQLAAAVWISRLHKWNIMIYQQESTKGIVPARFQLNENINLTNGLQIFYLVSPLCCLIEIINSLPSPCLRTAGQGSWAGLLILAIYGVASVYAARGFSANAPQFGCLKRLKDSLPRRRYKVSDTQPALTTTTQQSHFDSLDKYWHTYAQHHLHHLPPSV